MMNAKRIALFCAGLCLSAPTLAATVGWNYVEGGYTRIDIDGDGGDSTPDGFVFEGAMGFGDYVFGRVKHQATSDSDSGVDVDVDFTSVGIGYRFAASSSTDYYIVGSFERIGLEASGYGMSDSDSGNGFGAYAGIRSMLTESLEVHGELGYINVDDYDISDVSIEAGAHYYLAPQFAAGLSYKRFDDFGMLNATVRYRF